MRKRALRIISGLGGVVAILAITPSVGFAQDYVPTTQDYLNNIWVFIAGVLVFFMQAGFALVEAGMTRAKNVVNIFAKNMTDAIVGILAFFATGWAFAFGESGGWFIGTSNFFLTGSRPRSDPGRRTQPRRRRSSSRPCSPRRPSRSPPERWLNAPSSGRT